MFEVNYNGLRRRKTYDEVVNYLMNDQEIIRYPDRLATQLRNSPYLTQLDGEGMREMERQQAEEMKQREKEFQIRRLAGSSEHGSVVMRAMAHNVPVPSGGSSDLLDESYGTAVDDHIEEMAREAEQRRQSNIARLTQSIRDMAPDADTVAGIAHGAASAAQSAGIAALDLAGNVGRYAGRNLVENVRATPGVMRDAAGAVGSVASAAAEAYRQSQRPTVALRPDYAWIAPTPGQPAQYPDTLLGPMAASSSAGPAPKAKAKGRPKAKAQPLPVYVDPRQGGVGMDYNTDRAYWRRRDLPLQYLREQVAMRGLPLERRARSGRQTRLTRPELLNSLFATFD